MGDELCSALPVFFLLLDKSFKLSGFRINIQTDDVNIFVFPYCRYFDTVDKFKRIPLLFYVAMSGL